VPGVTEEVRHAFALATCNECHKSATGTPFLHVRTREPGNPSQLSAFLTQELSPTGPRVADFHSLLNISDADRIGDGRRDDHGRRDEKDDEEEYGGDGG
jgi:hypothetical protein